MVAILEKKKDVGCVWGLVYCTIGGRMSLPENLKLLDVPLKILAVIVIENRNTHRGFLFKFSVKRIIS